MARKTSKGSGSISARMDAIIADVRDCLLACAEARAECLEGCAAGGNDRQCRIRCYQANARCTRACRRKLDELQDLLLEAIAKEARG